MGRQALLAVVSWLTLSKTFGDQRFYSLINGDNVAAESSHRLYRNVPVGVYAGAAAPYGAYSFHLPTFAAAPKTTPAQITPVQENYVKHLMDSYGNKFTGTPQLGYMQQIAFPTQFVSLQKKLPEHLTQPLVAGSANYQFKQVNGVFGAPFRLPVIQPLGTTVHGSVKQISAPTEFNKFPSFGRLNGDKVSNLAVSTVAINRPFSVPNTQQQSTNTKTVFTTTHPQQQLSTLQTPRLKEPQIIIGKPDVQSIQSIQSIQTTTHDPQGEIKFQKIVDAPHPSHGEPQFQRIQEAPHHDDKYDEEPSQTYHSDSNQHDPHSSEEINYEEEKELPQYKTKFQVVHDKPHSPHSHGVKDTHEARGYVKSQEASSPHSEYSYASSYEKSHPKKPVENSYASNKGKAKLQSIENKPGNKQTITYVKNINGKKTIIELDTTPLPLLDITLLEPLKFDNPLVPQVQHFLPRINQATYTKLPELNLPTVKNYHKGASHDHSEGREHSHKDTTKKKHKKTTHVNKYPKKNDVPHKTVVTYQDNIDDVPEVTYEINAPNYKETIKEKVLSYNKATQSEPVTYTYGTNSQKEPVTYSFSHTSQEPIQIKTVQYHGNGPHEHLLYNLKPQLKPQYQHRANDRQQTSQESDEEEDSDHQQQQYTAKPQSAEQHAPTHKPQENYEIVHNNSPKYYSEPTQFTSENIDFQPILKEYENNIRSLAEPSAAIKVDPHQHVQKTPTPHPPAEHREEPPRFEQQRPHPSPVLQVPSTPEPHHHHQSSPYSESYSTPAPHIHEKSKSIIIQEESPDETHMLREQMREEIVNREENSEEDFEKAYQDAALGFPAYDQKSADSEKDIFDPESYGVPRDHVQYDFENTPFQQYQEAGDEFPKASRTSYRDERDKMKQDYYSDFAISKPESMLDRYQNKLNYYKLMKQRKPDYFIVDNNNENKKLAKFTAAPSFSFQPSSFYGQPKQKQQLYEFDFSQGAPRDSSAFASRPSPYKHRISFIEPQFQYGFEPLSVHKLLDSELAAMASNDSPESEKPGMRKKVYKENWYIKKTRTSAGAPSSR